jgi:hypothetical protein
MDDKTLIWAACGAAAQLLVGLLWKRWKPLEQAPNELIPAVNGVLGAVAYWWLLELPVKQAVLLAAATAYGAVVVKESITFAKVAKAAVKVAGEQGLPLGAAYKAAKAALSLVKSIF